MTREKVCFDKKIENAFQKSPQIYLSTSEADTKAKVCKKSNIQKFKQWHMSYIFTQQAISQAQKVLFPEI